MRGADLHLPRGAASDGIDEVVVTPEAAGWAYCGLRVVALGPGESRTFDTGDDEMAVLPLSGGGLTVEVDGRRFELDGRESVFARVTDWAYVPIGSRVRPSRASTAARSPSPRRGRPGGSSPRPWRPATSPSRSAARACRHGR